jgi:SAM-dependent methyltransferase
MTRRGTRPAGTAGFGRDARDWAWDHDLRRHWLMTEQEHPEWDASYTTGTPAAWDIGRPQPAFVRLADEGRLTGRLLDAGCGTGENALSRGPARKRPGAG